MKKSTRQVRIYKVALAGISAAVALLCVWLGVVIRYSTVAFFIAAGVALMVPTSQKFYLSSILAYVVSAGLSFLVAPDIFSVMGYVVYFGPMAVLSGILYDNRHKVKWWLALIIKIIYINGAIALLYFVCHNIVIDSTIAEKLPYWTIAIIGTIVLVVIDYILQFVYKRIAIIVGKALRKIDKKDQENVVIINDDEDEIDRSLDNPFDEFLQTDNCGDDKGNSHCDDCNDESAHKTDDEFDQDKKQD